MLPELSSDSGIRSKKTVPKSAPAANEDRRCATLPAKLLFKSNIAPPIRDIILPIRLKMSMYCKTLIIIYSFRIIQKTQAYVQSVYTL